MFVTRNFTDKNANFDIIFHTDINIKIVNTLQEFNFNFKKSCVNQTN